MPPHITDTSTLRQQLLRSCAEEGIRPRAVPFNAVCFYAYRISETGRTYPLIVDCRSLEEAVERAKVQCIHKEHLLIRETGEGKDKLHLFAIKKKSAARYVHRDHVTRAVHDLYAAKVCAMDAAVLL